jgi:signal transduction histidine kinase
MTVPLRPTWRRRVPAAAWLAVDVVAAAGCVLVVAAGFGGPHPLPFVVRFAVAALVGLPVAVRRRCPVVAAVCGVAMAAGTLALTGNVWPLLPVSMLLYVAAAAGTRTVRVATLAGWTAAVGGGWLLARQLGQAHTVTDALVLAMLDAGAWGLGYAVHERRRYAQQLRQQQTQAAAAQARQTAAEERLRLARELHDIVAHSMSLIAVQAGGGYHVADTQPAEARAALGAIHATSRDALTDLRRLLGVLRQPSPQPQPTPIESATAHAADTDGTDTAPYTPPPRLADIGRLIEHTAHAGVRTDLRITGSRRELPAAVELCAYRIVQEALTNVVRHAGTSSCQVQLNYQHNQLRIDITDHGTAAAPIVDGHGLTGMRERVSLIAGQLSATTLPDGGFQVTAHLPLHNGRP